MRDSKGKNLDLRKEIDSIISSFWKDFKWLLLNKAFQIFLISILTFLVYSNSLKNGFVWDDEVFIEDWPLVKTLRGVPYLLKGVYPLENAGKYRPVKGLILLADYKLFKLDPLYYHLQAIFIHISAVVLVYLIVFKIFKSKTAAFFGGLTFGVHPSHVEAITFVTSSTDILGISFALASFYFYLRQIEKGRRVSKNLVLSFLFAFLAFVTNEMAYILPLLLILYGLCFKHDFKIPKLKFYFPYFLMLGFLVFVRFFVFKVGSYREYFGDDFFLNMLLVPKILIKYIWLLVWPTNLSVNHDIMSGNLALRYVDFNPELAKAITLTNPEVLVFSLILLLIFALGAVSFKRLPLVIFLVGWFLISIAPVANVVPVNILFSERYVYLASVAYSIGFGLILQKVFELYGSSFVRQTLCGATVIFLGLLVLFFSLLTYRRNLDWKNPEALWAKTVKQAPESVIANYNLGSFYLEQEGKGEEALKYIERANDLSHVYFSKLSVNLGKAYILSGDPQSAISHLEKVIFDHPDNWIAYSYLGEAYFKMGKFSKAIENYGRSITNNPRFYESRIGLSNVYYKQQNYDGALEQLRMAQLINPYFPVSYNNIALVYTKQDKFDLAVKELEKGIRVSPNNGRLKESLQKVLEKKAKENDKSSQK